MAAAFLRGFLTGAAAGSVAGLVLSAAPSNRPAVTTVTATSSPAGTGPFSLRKLS